MNTVRTPDENFANLPGYPFEPNYLNVSGPGAPEVRMHYVDEGPKDGPVVLALHGQPSWSYLYRKMIPPLTEAGLRVIAPDLIGFGKSDKPVEQTDYTYQRHYEWVVSLIEQLELKNIWLFCQDWGGLIGLRIAGLLPDKFAGVIAANTGLPVAGVKMPEEWHKFKVFCQKSRSLPIGRLVKNGCAQPMDKEVQAAYDAPFPADEYKAGARVFPLLIPQEGDHPEAQKNLKAWETFRLWSKPFLTAFSDEDPITARGDLFFRRMIPGAKGIKHPTIKGGGHFLQEDCGEELARVVIDFVKK